MHMSAIDVISGFESSGGQGSWPFISKADVAAGARERIADASKIDQGSSSLCGPTSLLYSLIKKKPEAETGQQVGDSQSLGRAVGAGELLRGDRISLTVFTWGEGMRAVPRTGDLSLSSFLNNFYGYVAAL
jgi:hypothetical protein